MSTVEHRSEIDDEARLNRGFITVYEQVRETEDFEKGHRYVSLGYDDERYQLVNKGEPEQDFVVQAVPLAHIELYEPLDEDEWGEWVNSPIAKAILAPYFEALDAPDFATERGREVLDE